MISRVIEWCARNRFLVFAGVLFLLLAGIWSLQHIPLDALPDISDVQVIVHTPWAGRPPNVIEDQVTYPIVTTLLAAPHVKAVRADHVRRFLCVHSFSGRHRSLLGTLACSRIHSATRGTLATGLRANDWAGCDWRGLGFRVCA